VWELRRKEKKVFDKTSGRSSRITFTEVLSAGNSEAERDAHVDRVRVCASQASKQCPNFGNW